MKIKSVFVKDFLISTKVGPKRIEHLQGTGIISSEATFNTYFIYLFISASRTWKKQRNWSTSCFESNQYFKSVCIILRQVKSKIYFWSQALKWSIELKGTGIEESNFISFMFCFVLCIYFFILLYLFWPSSASTGLTGLSFYCPISKNLAGFSLC